LKLPQDQKSCFYIETVHYHHASGSDLTSTHFEDFLDPDNVLMKNE